MTDRRSVEMKSHMKQPLTQRNPSTNGLIAEGHVEAFGNPFALPIGLKGRLAGWYMSLPDAQHRELASKISVESNNRVVEVGFGPGQLLEMLRDRVSTLVFAGVDPSEIMVRRARRRNPRADLQVGAAAAMPFPDGQADLVISVNNVPMWPDPDAGLIEIRRVLRPGGRLVIAWHGGHDPRGHQRRLVLQPGRESEIDAAIRRQFPAARFTKLQHSDVWET
jgi:SAM-dependent methyltransferase